MILSMNHKYTTPGFTLIELLAVMAISAILLSVIIPVAQGTRRQLGRTQTKAQFQRYSLALEQYKAERGSLPALGSSPISLNAPPGRFAQLMSGHGLDGGAITDSEAQSQNPQGIMFLQFSPSELDDQGCLQDAFGQTDWTLYLDSDGNGFLDGLENIRGSIGWKSTGPTTTITSW